MPVSSRHYSASAENGGSNAGPRPARLWDLVPYEDVIHADIWQSQGNRTAPMLFDIAVRDCKHVQSYFTSGSGNTVTRGLFQNIRDTGEPVATGNVCNLLDANFLHCLFRNIGLSGAVNAGVFTQPSVLTTGSEWRNCVLGSGASLSLKFQRFFSASPDSASS